MTESFSPALQPRPRGRTARGISSLAGRATVLSTGALLGVLLACRSSFVEECPVGDLTCECGANDSCFEGLECQSGVCVEPDDPSESGDTSESMASEGGDNDAGDGDGDTTGSTAGDGDADTTGTTAGDGDGDGDADSSGDGDGDGDGDGGTTGDGDGDGDGDADPCAEVNCFNGTCAVENEAAVCDCDEGWAPPFCDTCDVGFHDENGECVFDETCDPSPCANGTCVESGGTIECVCQEGWTGLNCNTCAEGYHPVGEECLVDELCGSQDCINGSCEDGTGIVECTCDVGWALPNCDECATGFHDEMGSCVVDETCGSQNCINGSCDDSQGQVECTCDTGWALPNCDACDTNYHDEDGQCVLDEVCNASDCINGSCDDSTGIIECTCYTGWGLPNCDSCATGYHDNGGNCVEDESCTPGVCNNGTCDDSTLEVQCFCDAGWAPPNCDTAVDPGTAPNRIFATQAKFTGSGPSQSGMNLPELDNLCMTEATQAGLAGNYVAYFSDGTTNAADRIAGTRGFVNTNGEIVADQLSELTQGNLRYVPGYDATGTWNPGKVWTGSQYNGQLGSSNCNGWTSESGLGSGGTADSVFNWGGGQGFSCSTPAGIMCVQTDHNQAVAGIPAPPANARLIFLGPYIDLGGGLAAMDSECQSEWESKMGTNTGRSFKALVAPLGETAASRFDTSDAVWIRPDDVVVADSSADFFAGSWRTGVARKLTGPTTTAWVTTGADAPNLAGPSDRTCNDWTSTQSSDYYTQGFGAEVATNFNMGSIGTCNGNAIVYCAEN